MTQNTAQSEAMQAVRLLYVAACGGGSSDHKNPEMIYRARVLLEGFIEDNAPISDIRISQTVVYKGVNFTEGHFVSVGHDKVLIDSIVGGIAYVIDRQKSQNYYGMNLLLEWNPDGSFVGSFE
jgi:hypothetical protein